jgi:hypothetical protein
MATPLSEETAQKLLAQGSGNSAAQPQQAGLNAAGANKGLKDLSDGAASLYFGFNRLNSGTDAATAGLAALSKGAQAVGLNALGKGLDLFGGALLQQKTNMDKASAELGIGGNNIGLFVRMAGDAGLTTQQFSEVIKRADGSIGGLGITAQQSALNFSKVQKQIVETGDQLNKMGISAQEQAEITAMATMNDAKRNANDKAGQAAIAKSAIDLAMSLDETAKITGQSRQAIMDSIKAEEKKPLAQLAMMQMDEKQRENYEKVQQQVQKLGPGFMSLTTEIATGGVQTKEGLAMLQAMGPEAANKYQAATELMLNAKTDEQKKVAQAQMDEAQAAVQRRMADEEFKRLVKSGTAEQQQAAANLVMGNKAMMSVQSEANKNGGDYVKAIKDQREAVQATQAGLKVDEKTGKATTEADEGQKVAQDLNAMNKAAAIAAGGLSHNFEDVNKKLATTPAYIDAMNAAMKKVSGGATTMEQAEKAPSKIAKGLNEIVSGGKEGPTKTTGGASSLPKDYEPTKKRAGGTLAETGSAVEPEDAIVKIHKGETVLNPDATKAMGKQLSAGSKAPGGVNFSEISKSVSTSISSMSGGGSTETKQVQNDSSKAAEKELAAVREQMQAEKNALREQLKAQMGDGSKLGGSKVSYEMRTGDEGKAIGDKYKAIMEPLQKQIEAGISWETTKKASAIEETKKVVEEQTKISFSGNAKQLEAFKSKTKDEDNFFGDTKKKTSAELADQAAKKDEIFKAAELARSVVGYNVKGLSDDAIAAILPISASMDDFYIDMNDNIQSFSNDSANNLKKITDNEQASSTIKISASEAARKVSEDMGLKSIESATVAGKAQEQYHSQFTESQQKIIDDYKGYSEENRSFHAKAMEKGAKEDAETAQMIGERITKMKAEIGDRQATTEELAAIENETLNKAMFEKQAASKREMQDVMENLNEYSATREKELKQQAANEQVSMQEETVAKISEVTKTAQADALENANTTVKINGKIVDPNSAEGKAALGKMEEAKAKMNQVMGGMMPDMSKMMAGGGKLTVNGKEGQGAMASMKDSMKSMMPDSKSLPGLDSLVKEISSGGVQSKEGLATMQAMGPEASNKFSAAVAAMQSATTADEKAKAKLQMDEAQASIAKRTQDKDFASLLKSGTKEQQAAAVALLEKSNTKTAQEVKANEKKPGEVGYVSEQANKLTSGFGKIGAGNDMFNPKIVNKVSDEEFAKLTAKNKTEGAPKPAATASAPKTTEAAAKKEETKTTGKPGESEQAKAAATKETPKEAPKAKTAEATLKDLNDQLIMLNRHMVELINHSATTADASSKTAKTAAKSTGRAF